MTCDDVELRLLENPDDDAAELRAHLQGCEACRTFRDESAQVLALAKLPSPTREERQQLEQLPAATARAWSAQQTQRSAARSVLGYALAASLGALVASGGWWANPRVVERERVVTVRTPAVDATPVELAFADETADSTDELSSDSFFEVSWPTVPETLTAEGETP